MPLKMNRTAFVLALVLALPPSAKAASSAFSKVLVIVLENTDYDRAAAQPFMTKLAARGATLTGYNGVAHPSQPNYVAMIAGDTLGVKDDKPVDLSGRHLGDLLDAKGLSWGVYAEGYPGGCFLGDKSGRYARKHVPFLSFTSVQKSPAKCARVQDASALDADAAAGRLPAFSLYVPDLDDDGHDTGVAVADRWLAGFLGPKLDDAGFMKGLLVVVTFDESASKTNSRILTILLGAGIKPGSASAAAYDHYSLLRTIEDGLGLGDLGRKDSSASPIDGVWSAN
ncbi:MAG: alkaline phosphatase family protein [Elusimicrobia bacterium]|nr:alkaline phosphatase family protein [Elusimicrobiota bacterium]